MKFRIDENNKSEQKNTHEKTTQKSSLGLFNKKLVKIFKSKSNLKGTKLKFVLENLTICEIESYKVLSEYQVGKSTVYIAANESGKVFYLISEPKIDNIGKLIYSRIMNYLYVSLSSELQNQEMSIQGFIRKKIIEISKALGIYRHTANIVDTLTYYIMRDSLGFGIIDVPMKDSNIEDIVEESFEHPVGIVHRNFGEYGVLDTNIKFSSLEATNAFVQKIVQKTGKSMTAAVPYIDTMTKEGHRVAATFGKEVSIPGPNFTIRKFSEEPYTITMLLEMGTLNPLMAAYIWLLLEAKAFVLVIGATSAGKTTTIGALSTLINPQMKITTIEDTPELKIGHIHWQRLVTRKSSSILEDKYEVTMDDLTRLSLRSRPDYIIVGEVRGKEISSLIQAVSTGHGGLTSFHATDANSALVRMESPPMNVYLSGQMLISVILHQNRLVDPNGKITRKITKITEVIPLKNQINLENVFEWNHTTGEFRPNDITQLIKKSTRLKEVARVNGWDESDLANQLITRVCFLSKMVVEGKKNFSTVTQEFAKFYYDPITKYMVVLDTPSLGELRYTESVPEYEIAEGSKNYY